jgi:hypothetical protein
MKIKYEGKNKINKGERKKLKSKESKGENAV